MPNGGSLLHEHRAPSKFPLERGIVFPSSLVTLMALFLGLDLSTQSLKAAVTNEQDVVVYEGVIFFDKDLPQYGTINGAITGPEDGTITCPVALWVEALELVIDRLKDGGVPLGSVVAVSGGAQVSSAHALLGNELHCNIMLSNMGACTGHTWPKSASTLSIPISLCTHNLFPKHSPNLKRQYGKIHPLVRSATSLRQEPEDPKHSLT